jgi:hypothetical protein
LVVAAGGNDALVSDAIVGALSFDVATGAVATLDTSVDGVLRQPRAFATVTAFGERMLVAGGEQPVFGVPELDIEPQGSAEIFDPALGRFTGESIALLSTRTHHAALTLDDGRTLLVGGRTKVGGTNIAQYRLEIVDPANGRASVAATIAPRIDPQALRLSDGRIFIAGGVGLDGSLTQPVGEWLSADARHEDTQLTSDVPPRFERAFLATTGGGVLAVGGCEDRPATSDEDAARCALCSHGCPPAGDGFDAWWVDRNGAAAPVSLAGISAPRPILLPGSDGSPWLVASTEAAPTVSRLFRFNPWAAGFEPAAAPDDLRLPLPGKPAPLSLGPDAFVWIDDSDAQGALFGLRLGTRNRFAQDVALVLSADLLDLTRPEHLVPEGPTDGALSYDGKLTLEGDVAVRVADTDYEDVTVALHLDGGAPPIVLLGDTQLGGLACPWPDDGASGGDFELATVARRKAHAELGFHGGKAACNVETGRLSLGLRAGSAKAIVQQMDVTREVVAR